MNHIVFLLEQMGQMVFSGAVIWCHLSLIVIVLALFRRNPSRSLSLKPSRETDSAVVSRILTWIGACVELLQQQHGWDG